MPTSTSPCSKLRLGDLLTRRKDEVLLQDGVLYRRITIRVGGRGVVIRDELDGAAIGTKRQFLVRAGQFVLSKIDAQHGAFGLVPDECDGAIITGNFWAFDIDAARIHPRYLEYLSKTFMESSARDSAGTTNRKYLDEERFLEVVVSLPDLAEQAKAVAWLDDQFERGRSVRLLAGQIGDDVRAFKRAYLGRSVEQLAALHPSVRFGDLIRRCRAVVELQPLAEYEGVGTRMWGEGTYVHERRLGQDFEAERYAVGELQLIYNEVWAHNGAIGVVRDASEYSVVSRHFHVFDVDWAAADPDYLTWIFRSPWFWHRCRGGSVGTSGRGHMRRRHLEEVRIPLPALELQRAFAREASDITSGCLELLPLADHSASFADRLLLALLDTAVGASA